MAGNTGAAAAATAIITVGALIVLTNQKPKEPLFLELGDPQTIRLGPSGKATLVLTYLTNAMGEKIWQTLSGPAGSIIDDTGEKEATMVFAAAGEYEVKLTIIVGQGADEISDTKIITVVPSPTLELGEDRTLELDAQGEATLVLDYQLSDQGSKAWDVISGPAGVGILNTRDTQATLRFTTAGSYQIKLTVEVPGFGPISDTIGILVKELPPPIVTAVRISPTSGAMNVGDIHQLTATCTWSDGFESDCTAHADTEWSSSNPLIATVTARGLITGVDPGDVVIRAIHGGREGTSAWAVGVPPPPVRVITGDFPLGFTVPTGEIWEMRGYVSSGTVDKPASVIVEAGGELRAFGKYNPDLEFKGTDKAAWVGGPFTPTMPITDPGLYVRPGGKLVLEGTPKLAWEYGQTNHPTWLPTDELVECPMFFSEIDNSGPTGVGGFKPYTIGQPLRTMPNGVPLPVLNLTRDIKIRGTPGGFSHIHIESDQIQILRYVELSWMGVPLFDSRGENIGVMGRYPIHFHMCGDGSRGSVVEGVAVKHSGNRAFVRHLSNGILLKDCIAYDIDKSAYWWDDLTMTVDAPTEHCVAAWVRRARNPQRDIVGGFAMAGFTLNRVLRGSVNNCLAVGISARTNSSGYAWTESSTKENPSTWEVDDDVSLANSHLGAYIWQNTDEEHTLATRGKFTAIHCEQAGYKSGAYRNGWQYRQVEVYNRPGSPAAGAEFFATTSNKSPRADGYNQAHESIVVRNGDHGMIFKEHVLPGDIPVLLRGWDIQNVVGAKVLVDENRGGPSPAPGLWDIVDCGITPADVDIMNPTPGTTIRIQQGAEAWRHITVVGVPFAWEAIAPFYPSI